MGLASDSSNSSTPSASSGEPRFCQHLKNPVLCCRRVVHANVLAAAYRLSSARSFKKQEEGRQEEREGARIGKTGGKGKQEGRRKGKADRENRRTGRQEDREGARIGKTGGKRGLEELQLEERKAGGYVEPCCLLDSLSGVFSRLTGCGEMGDAAGDLQRHSHKAWVVVPERLHTPESAQRPLRKVFVPGSQVSGMKEDHLTPQTEGTQSRS